MITLPPPPDALTPRGEGVFTPRFEDIAQDGRMVLEAIPQGLGISIWRPLLEGRPIAQLWDAQGVLPVLSRLVVQGTRGPFSVDQPVSARGCYQLARTVDASGATERIVLNMWSELSAPLGRTYDPQPAEKGTLAPAGRVFGEHVFTRPFAPEGERRVRSLNAPGVPAVPELVYTPANVESVLALPAGAVALDAALTLDPCPVVFGVGHTDSNQHVNSLVYPRLFEDAALRRFMAHGRGARWIARAHEVVFRKPSFAGESVRVALQAFALGEALGVVGVCVSEADAASFASEGLARARPRTWACVTFEPG